MSSWSYKLILHCCTAISGDVSLPAIFHNTIKTTFSSIQVEKSGETEPIGDLVTSYLISKSSRWKSSLGKPFVTSSLSNASPNAVGPQNRISASFHSGTALQILSKSNLSSTPERKICARILAFNAFLLILSRNFSSSLLLAL